MSLVEGMFLFEVMVESVKSLIESKRLVIKSDFADIFSLELRDPKDLNIVMPEPPPLPPEPPGKKGKKPKPKPKPKGKKKKGMVDEAPPEPVIQSGQSVLFACSAEFLIQNMRKFPIEISLWDRDERLVYIGSNSIPWDEVYLEYLSKIANCQDPLPVSVKDEYNIFEEGTAKLVAKLGIQIKLSFLKDKVISSFRTLSEDSSIRKYLYTGLNSKTTSYICNLKTDEEIFIKNSNKIENNFTQDKMTAKTIQYANYTNAPAANLTFFEDGAYCCMKKADKPPESIYKSPETCPDIDDIVDYVRKIIVSCNDNMRMLTPQPNIRPRIKATDIDRLCRCNETGWPQTELAQRMKQEVQNETCIICKEANRPHKNSRSATIDIANIRGPCGKPDCRIARDLRSYIENLVEEDNKEININEILGPCGSNKCSLAEKLQQFLRHEGVFNQISTLEGLSTQCACMEKMMNALLEKKQSCQSICSKDCINASSSNSEDICGGVTCPTTKNVYNVYYFTVENFNDTKSASSSSKRGSQPVSEKPSKHKYCSSECPTTKTSHASCSKSACSGFAEVPLIKNSKCDNIQCQNINIPPASPADSDIVFNLDDLYNPCCVKSCDVVDKVKDFIVEAWENKQKKTAKTRDDPCYCDCDCNFYFSKKTTYCAICGGFEVKGSDIENQPVYARPHPCPVYHKLYDKKSIKVQSPWNVNEDEKSEKPCPSTPKTSKKYQKDKLDENTCITSKEDVKPAKNSNGNKSQEKKTKQQIAKNISNASNDENVEGNFFNNILNITKYQFS